MAPYSGVTLVYRLLLDKRELLDDRGNDISPFYHGPNPDVSACQTLGDRPYHVVSYDFLDDPDMLSG